MRGSTRIMVAMLDCSERGHPLRKKDPILSHKESKWGRNWKLWSTTRTALNLRQQQVHPSTQSISTSNAAITKTTISSCVPKRKHSTKCRKLNKMLFWTSWSSIMKYSQENYSRLLWYLVLLVIHWVVNVESAKSSISSKMVLNQPKIRT